MKTRFFPKKVKKTTKPIKKTVYDQWFVVGDQEWLGKQRLFICAESCRDYLAGVFKIPGTRIVSLIESPPDYPEAIPEKPLHPSQGLNLFATRLEKIADEQNDVIIHCKQGRNRSPVAAVMYLALYKNLPFTVAYALVEHALRRDRGDGSRVNPFGYYTNMLSSIYKLEVCGQQATEDTLKSPSRARTACVTMSS